MKKLLILFLIIGLTACSVTNKTRSLSHPYTGQTANDHTGDPLKTGFDKVNIYLSYLDNLPIENLLATSMELNLMHGVANQKDIKDLAPMYYHAAGDTSNYPVPYKIGDFYSDDSTGELYYAKTAARDGWIKLN